MARVIRKRSKTGIYHVMLRGVNRQTIFEDDEDRNMFIATLDSFRGDNRRRDTGTGVLSHYVNKYQTRGGGQF